MNFIRNSYRSFKGKHKFPWLYRREDLLDDTVSFSEIFDTEFHTRVETLIGEWINKKYIILSFLGRGTFSLVYMAYSFCHQKFIVLKLILPCYYQEGKYETNIINEIIKSRKDFPYHIFKWNKHPRIIFIEQPYYGIPMADLVLRNNYNTLSIEVIISFFYYSLKQIDELHQANIIHADIKLDNILTSYHTEYTKDLQTWFSSLLPHRWIYNLAMFTKTQNEFRRIKWSWEKCLRHAKKQFKKHFANEFLEFKKERNEKKIQELENVKEVEDFDTYSSDCLEEVNLDNKITMEEPPYASIIDFGNAIIDDEVIPDDICFENYRPPENMIHLEISKKTDIWSLGCIFYEMLTRSYLFSFEKNENEINRNNHVIDENDRSNSSDSDYSILSSDSENSINKNANEIYEFCSYDITTRKLNIKNKLKNNMVFLVEDTILELIVEVLASMLNTDPNTRHNSSEILKLELFKPFTYDTYSFNEINV